MKSSFLYFSKKERRGIAFLLILLLFVIVIKYMLLLYPTKSVPPKFENIVWDSINTKKPEYTYLAKKDKRSSSVKNYERKSNKKSNYKPKELFLFDPNHLSEDSFQLLPINNFAKKNILKYRANGGIFYSSKDLGKIYNLTPEEFIILDPYISIKGKKKLKFKYEPKTIEKININSATEEQLKSLYGIGEILSKRIIKYRDKIGGFYSINQLQEVYGLSDSTFISIQKKILTNGGVQKIKINEVDYKELSSHPYITYTLAKVITKYRLQHGIFENSDDLQKIKIMDSATLIKILPYIEFE